MTITQPGFIYGMSERDYHADPCETPSLSSGIARKIINSSITHAHEAHPRLGGAAKPRTDSMGLGSLVHSLMDDSAEKGYELGNFIDYKTGDARKWRDGVSAAGKSPILQRDLADAYPIADALRKKTALGSKRDPFLGDEKCEVTGIWKEGETYCRARFDRMAFRADGAVDVWDWKTAADVSDRAIIKSVCKYAYHIQVAFYLRGLSAILGHDRATFTLVFVETSSPFTVRCVRISDTFLSEGKWRTEQAIDAWRVAMANEEWSDPREREIFEAEMPAYMDDTDIEITTI